MPNMCKLYFDQIQAGTRTIDTVPAMLKAGVQALIDANSPQTKVATGDGGVAIKAQVPSDAPHVDATADPTPAG